MRILILSNLYPPLAIGGYERACANVAEGLFRRGHEVRALTTWSHIPSARPDPHYVQRSWDLRDFVPHLHKEPHLAELQKHESRCATYANALRLIETLRDFSPEIVYVWNLYGVGIAGNIDVLDTAGVPWVVHLMDVVPAYLDEAVPPHVLDIFDAREGRLWDRGGVIAMSVHLLDEILDRSHIRLHERASVIPGWVDIGHARRHGPYRRDGITRFVTAGVVSAYKGTGLIVEAAAALRRSGIGPFEIDVFGSGEIVAYVEMAERHGVSDLVRFRGPRALPDLLRAYAEYDAFLFPTWEREPFGLAPLEAAGCATPPIMTRECGAAERLVDGVHCIKIGRATEALTAAMADVIEGNTDVEKLGAACAGLVRADLSFEKALERIERVLNDAKRDPVDWRSAALDDPRLPLLTFLKHDLAIRMRFA